MWNRRRNSKYNSTKRVCTHGHKHDSIREQRRCEQLYLLQEGGVIENLKVQDSIELVPKFEFNGVKYRPASYKADFTYYDKQIRKFVIEDTKGMKTQLYILKQKILLNSLKDRSDIVFLET